MIEAIREIGKWQIEKSGKSDLDVLTKEPKFKEGGKIVIVFIKIDLDKKEFKDIDPEDYDSTKINKYLYRSGVSRGPNPTPIANIIKTKKGKSDAETYQNLRNQLEKTFTGKIQKWFDKYSQGTIQMNADTDLQGIREILAANKDEILEKMVTAVASLSKKEGRLLTIKIIQDKESRYIGDFDIFRKLLEDIESRKIAGISEKDKNCSVCSAKKGIVSGEVSVFKFYTIDKPGFIAGGFKKNRAWRNYPVCSTCKLELEEGRKYIEKFLSYRFYGHQYLLIPKTILGDIVKKSEIVDILMDSKKVISLKERTKKRITNDEAEILNILSEEHDFLTLNFLFLRKDQSAERIELFIEDVFPSRIKRIFEAKEAVDRMTTSDFTFSCLRDFFSKSDAKKRNYDLDKYFLDITDKIFRGVFIDFSFLLRFFMARIRKEFVTDGYYGSVVKNAIMTTIFLENLGLIAFKEEKNMTTNIFDDMFTHYGKSFKSPAKQGIFLLGALTQLLLNKQWSERNAKPFAKQLKSLKMAERDIKALLPKVQNKLEEYESFDKGKRLLATEASKRLLEAGEEGWMMPMDEINFYFACGMNLVDDVAKIIYPNRKEE